MGTVATKCLLKCTFHQPRTTRGSTSSSQTMGQPRMPSHKALICFRVPTMSAQPPLVIHKEETSWPESPVLVRVSRTKLPAEAVHGVLQSLASVIPSLIRHAAHPALWILGSVLSFGAAVERSAIRHAHLLLILTRRHQININRF